MDNNEIIYTDEQYASQMYFIKSGIIEFFFLSNGEMISYIDIQSNYYFGEVDLLLSENRNHFHNTKTGEICELLTLSKENFFSLLINYPDDSFDICEHAKERLNRTNEELKDAMSKLRNSLAIDKKRTYPKATEFFSKLRLKVSSNESTIKEEDRKSKSLFDEIAESKLKTKEFDGKYIKKKAVELEKASEELKNVTYTLQDLVALKNVNFKTKFPKFSPDTSLDGSRIDD